MIQFARFSSRNALAASLTFLTTLLALAGDGLAAQPENRPNILLIMADDQGYWDTGISGNEKIDTPVMDKLATGGVNFTRFYASMVCAPTRAGLMTGRYYLRTGLYNTRFGGDTLGADEITLPELLKGVGYRTALIGKWHLGKYAGYQPHQRGFDEFFGHYHGHIERYDYPDQLVHNGRPIETRGYVTDLLTDAAIDFIAADRGQPFFCYLAYNAPHSPFVAGASHDGMPRGDELIEKYLKRGLPLREARIYAMVEIIDHNVGRILDRLDELGLSDDTLVIYTSDNGGVSRAYKAGLRGGKGSAWEGGVRVPMFVRWPGKFAAGASVDAMASHIDWLPTFCDLLDIDLPSDRTIDGRSILGLLQNGAGASPHDYVYHTWDRYTPNPHNRWGVFDGRYKLVGHAPSGQPPEEKPGELFDLLADPGEKKNIASANPEIAARLRAEFVRWFDEVTEGVTYEPIAIPIGHPEENNVEIQPSWATLISLPSPPGRGQGEGLGELQKNDAPANEKVGESLPATAQVDMIQYTFRGYDWDTIDRWSTPGAAATWKLDVLRPGRYEVAVSYGRSPATSGGELRLSVGAASLTHQPQATPTGDAFTIHHLGILDLSAGPATLKAEVSQASEGELMRLNRIWLERLEDGAAE